MRLVLASRNPHKLRELRELLAPHELVALPDQVELPPETGSTFAENAGVKARAAARATGLPTVADDSGIEAAALDGMPGVRSARFAGAEASEEENLAKLLRDVPRGGDRRIAYVCALAFVPGARDGGGAASPPSEAPQAAPADGSVVLFEARCQGRLAVEPRGSGGFGYDPAFVPDGVPGDRTMAELTPTEKDAFSHRGQAARAFLEWLEAPE